MKDQDLRTETAARKRLRKKALRRAGVPTFVFRSAGLDSAVNAGRRIDNGYRRLREETEAHIRRAKRVAHDSAARARAFRTFLPKERVEA